MTKNPNSLSLKILALVLSTVFILSSIGCSGRSEPRNKAVAFEGSPSSSSVKPAMIMRVSSAYIKEIPTIAGPATPLSGFTLCAVGDINTGSRPTPYVKKYGYPEKNLRDLLGTTDLTFGNLECALSLRGSPVPGKRFTFRGSPQDASALKNMGFDILSIANNHSKDYGTIAFFDTLSSLDQAQVVRAGGGKNSQEAYKAAIITANGTKIAFLAFSGILPGGFTATSRSSGVASLRNTKAVLLAIKEAREKADIVVVSLHWGKELSTRPSTEQIKLAHQFIDAGADTILGHHPHVVQGIEIYKGKIIAYSLGNFMFSPGNAKGRQSVLLSLKMQNGKLISARVYPVYINGIKPTLLVGKKGQAWLTEIAKRSDMFKTLFQIRGSTDYASLGPPS